MRSNNRRVILELSLTRCDLRAIGRDGKTTESRSFVGEAAPEESAWTERLEQIQPVIAAWVAELDLEGARATTIYSGPETAASTFGFPVAVGSTNAQRAARIAFADTLSYPIEEAVCSVGPVFKDSSPRDQREPTLHMLAAAEPEQDLIALYEMLDGTGLRVARLIPASGASLASAVQEISRVEPGRSTVKLWVGERSTALAAGDSSHLSFARLVPVGAETLIEAIAEVPLDGGLTLSIAEARRLLVEHGLPSMNGWSAGETGPSARSLLPLLQPVLQRLIVEIKQSVRFGLDAESKRTSVLGLVGPGAAIAGLDCVLSESTDIPLEQQPVDDQSWEPGDVAALESARGLAPELVPNSVFAGRIRTTTRRALWLGAAAACLGLASDAAISWLDLSASNRTIASLNSVSGEHGVSARDTRDAVLAATVGLARARTLRDTAVGSTVPIGAAVSALANLTPEHVELVEISFESDSDSHTMGVRGQVHADGGENGATRLREYADALEACPLISAASLGEVRRVDDGEQSSIAFEVQLELVPLPRVDDRQLADATDGESS